MEPTKVLAVDDSDLMHRMYGVMLRGVELLHARDGVQALDLIAANADIDLVLLDINMPNMNGFELLQAIKADDELKHLPVLMVTAEARKEDIVQAAQSGAAGYIVKPFTKATLEEKVGKIMQRRATA